jgi:hypothetical protein
MAKTRYEELGQAILNLEPSIVAVGIIKSGGKIVGRAWRKEGGPWTKEDTTSNERVRAFRKIYGAWVMIVSSVAKEASKVLGRFERVVSFHEKLNVLLLTTRLPRGNKDKKTRRKTGRVQREEDISLGILVSKSASVDEISAKIRQFLPSLISR